jgi:hypothetical protein
MFSYAAHLDEEGLRGRTIFHREAQVFKLAALAALLVGVIVAAPS